MAPFRPPGFAGRLSALDREEFAGFLADLWEGRGREARIEDGVLVEGDGTRLLVHHPPRWRPSSLPAADDPAVDGIVTSRRAGGGPAGVRVVDAADLRDMVRYAVGRETREALADRYFGGAPPVPEREGGPRRVSASVGVGAVGVAGVLLIVAAVVAAGGFGGLAPAPGSSAGGAGLESPRGGEAGTIAPTPVPEPTATPTTSSSGAGTATATPAADRPTPGSRLLALDRDGTQYDDDPYPVPIEVEGGVTIIEFEHPGEGGYYALWTDEGNGSGRFLAGGQGAGSVRVLANLPEGRHTLHVRAIGGWSLEVRASRPPAALGLTGETAETEFGGPMEFRGATNVTVRGIDPNATYEAALVDGEGTPRNVLVDGAGPTGAVSTVVKYRGTGFVRMTSTGRWVATLRPAERGGPPHFVEVLRDGADGRRSGGNVSASRELPPLT